MSEIKTYTLIDSGHGRKLERFGAYTLIRPCSQALWQPQFPEKWQKADAEFSREENKGWMGKKLPPSWLIELEGITLKLSSTDFGHLGVFPEHQLLWKSLIKRIKKRKDINFLNLFAYSGGASLGAAQAGAKVCHVDASKGMIAWARENAELNQLNQAPIRWIADDVLRFLKREINRQKRYDMILLDPPSFGRGSQGEVFKIERDLPELLSLCKALLSEHADSVFMSCHTPGVTPIALENLFIQYFKTCFEKGELILPGSFPIPSGSYAVWHAN